MQARLLGIRHGTQVGLRAVAAVIASLAFGALHGSASASCVNLDPAEIERFGRLVAEQEGKATAASPATTTQDVAAALRKAKLPQADVVGSLPGAVEEWPLEFLDGGTFLRVTLDEGYRTHVLQFVRQGKRIIPVERGREGRARIERDVRVVVRDASVAIRYAQWLLEATGEPGLFLVRAADEVPFTLVKKTDEQLTAKVAAAREDLRAKIQPPGADASGPGFVVHQDAVLGRDLVRYTVKVSKLGLATIEAATLAKDLPVVSVAAAP